MSLDWLIKCIAQEHENKIQKKVLASSKIFTTKSYRDAFERKWGYPLSAKGYLVPPREWSALMQELNEPEGVGGISYFPDGSRSLGMGEGLALVEDSRLARRFKDHETLHLALNEHSDGFQELFTRKALNQKWPFEMRLRLFEAEILAETLAYKGMLKKYYDKNDFWEKFGGIIYQSYRHTLSEMYAVDATGYLRDTKRIIGLVKDSRMSCKELFQAFVELDYDMPFAEARAALK